ncbi:hypothetical protein Tco_0532917 [Tanacetum coccineum]
MTTPVVDASEDFLAGLLIPFYFLVGSSGEAGTVVNLGEACFLNFCAFLRDESQSVYQIVISGGMHDNLVSLGDCLVFSKEVVNDNFGESRVVHLVLLFVTYVVDLTSVDDGCKSSPRLMHLINNDIGDCLDFPNLKDISEDFQIEVEFLLLVHSEPVGVFIPVDRIPELVHIKFGLLSSDEIHDSAEISHIQFIYKQIFSLKDNLDHENVLLYKQRKDLSIWTKRAVMANGLFTDDSFVYLVKVSRYRLDIFNHADRVVIPKFVSMFVLLLIPILLFYPTHGSVGISCGLGMHSAVFLGEEVAASKLAIFDLTKQIYTTPPSTTKFPTT